jgi:hypothetical protein
MSFDNENLMRIQVQSGQTSATELRSGQIFYGWWVVLASAIGLFWGVPIDRTGSYRAVRIAFLAATLLASVLMTRLGPYRYCAPSKMTR